MILNLRAYSFNPASQFLCTFIFYLMYLFPGLPRLLTYLYYPLGETEKNHNKTKLLEARKMNHHDKFIINQQLNQLNNLIDLLSERFEIAGAEHQVQKLKSVQSQLSELEVFSHAA